MEDTLEEKTRKLVDAAYRPMKIRSIVIAVICVAISAICFYKACN